MRPGITLPDKFSPAELGRPLTDRFLDQVSRYPDRLAVQDTSVRLTYAELNVRANQIAHLILKRLGAGNEPVAMLFKQDVHLITNALGILLAGKFFVPLDPRYPPARNAAMLADSGTRLLLTDDINHHLALEIGNDASVVNTRDLPSSQARDPGIALTPESLAGLYYTSGSTGKPKGVMMNHKTLMHYTMIYSKAIGIQPDDRLSLLSPFTYAAALADIFGALLNGAALLLFDFQSEGVSAIARWMAAEGVTVFRSTSTLFRSLCLSVPPGTSLDLVRVVRLGGERISAGDVDLYIKTFSDSCILYLVFASTEALLMSDQWLDKSSVLKGRLAPAGRPVEGKRISIVDDAGNPVPINARGEIVVQSRYLSPGYWRQPELTRAVFSSEPGGETSFRTGDLGLIQPDGNLIYLGRKDAQVKIRGHRVETTEVESVLAQVPGVRTAVVTLRNSASGDPALAAYLVPAGPPPSLDDVRAFLSTRLPTYMRPSVYGMIPSVPLNANGKIDYAALPEPVWRRPPGREFVQPRDESEMLLTSIWERALSLEPIGITDNFFDLGGDSLIAARLVSEVEKRISRPVPLEILVRAPTIQQMAAWMRIEKAARPRSPVVRLRGEGTQPPLFVVPGDQGLTADLMPISMLLPHLDATQPVYGLSVREAQDARAPEESIPVIARRLVKCVREVQPHGPYLLAGVCIGGLVAYEMGHQLQGCREEIGLLALFDTHARGYKFEAFKASDDWAGARRARSRLRSAYLTARVLAPEVIRFPTLKLGQMLPFLARTGCKGAGIYNKYLAEQNERYLYQWYRLALKRYRIRRYGLSPVLFVNQEWHTQDPRLGWERVGIAGPDVQVLSGTHQTYFKDHAESAARKLQLVIDARMKPQAGGNRNQRAAATVLTPSVPSTPL